MECTRAEAREPREGIERGAKAKRSLLETTRPMWEKFLCHLMIDYVLGINSAWISTDENYIADEISRLKKLLGSQSSKQYSFDYSSLPQKYPELQSCRFFQPSPNLLSVLWGIVLQKKLPSLQEVQTLKQSGLGKLTTYSGL